MPNEDDIAGRRRWRQLAEIERLLALGCDERAGGLVAEHLAQFPLDARELGRLLALFRPPTGQDHPGGPGPGP